MVWKFFIRCSKCKPYVFQINSGGIFWHTKRKSKKESRRGWRSKKKERYVCTNIKKKQLSKVETKLWNKRRRRKKDNSGCCTIHLHWVKGKQGLWKKTKTVDTAAQTWYNLLEWRLAFRGYQGYKMGFSSQSSGAGSGAVWAWNTRHICF